MSSSTIVATAKPTGHHVLKINGYTLTKHTVAAGDFIASSHFTVGDHSWRIKYYPNGNNATDENPQKISLMLDLVDCIVPDAGTVKAQFVFSLLDDDGEPVSSFTHSTSEFCGFPGTRSSSWGFVSFITHGDLEKYLKDDCFAVRCDVTVMNGVDVRVVPASLDVPESDLHLHLGRLLSTGDGADVTFNVGGETFVAHRCVLAARSPVFKVELIHHGVGRCVDVDDIDGDTFRALLHFIYTDTLLDLACQGDMAVMARRLVAVAERYKMERLKLICEEKLTMMTIKTGDHEKTQTSQGQWFFTRFFNFGLRTNVTATATVKSGNASPSCSTIVLSEESGHHVLRIEGYRRTKIMAATGEHLDSGEFHVGRYTWRLRYYPNGYNQDFSDSISFALVRTGTTDDVHVHARVKISLLDLAGDGEPVARYSHCDEKCTFSKGHDRWAFKGFIKSADLENSGHLVGDGDCFAVRCDITFNVQELHVRDLIAVPLPLLCRHLGDIFASEEAADVEFQVNGETFPAHRCVLAARSPVFKAKLLGSMKEHTERTICVNDIDAAAFRALLHFIYTDKLPPEMNGGGRHVAAMAQHLLVAADRYGMERLKKVCEDVLFRHVNIGTAATSLALAEQHGCPQLKDAILRFFMSPARLKAVMASDGYAHLVTSFPAIATEILAMLAAHLA